MDDADLVLSVNSSHDAMTALENALPALRAGTLWADLNTASPGLKVALAERAAGHGVAVVDVALMSPVPGKGLRTPMLVSGEAADRYAELLAGLGADVAVQPGPVGTAISRKLLRSVFYKGLAAAVVEALRGAEAAGCADWLRANIAAELAGFDERTVDRLVDGTHTHARRRADEMDAATEQLQELGVPARIAAGRPRPAGGAAGRADLEGDHMIIDCHGHYTTAPAAHTAWREQQVSAWEAGDDAAGLSHRSATTRSGRPSSRASCG